MNTIIIFCAVYLLFVVMAGAFVYWLILPRKQKTTVLIFGLITVAVGFILAKTGGAFFYDARPFVSDHVTSLFKYTADNGFPSDHTLLTANIAAAVFTVSRKWGAAFLAAAMVIGVSRVLAHVHHPIDILGSLVFAAIGAAIAYYVTPKITGVLARQSFAGQLGLGHAKHAKQD